MDLGQGRWSQNGLHSEAWTGGCRLILLYFVRKWLLLNFLAINRVSRDMHSHYWVGLVLLILTQGSVPGADGVAELMKKGGIHDEKLEPKEALEYYLEAEKMEPENVAVLLGIARQYRHWAADVESHAEKVKLSDTGKAYSQKALALAPNEAEAHLSVAICHAKRMSILGNSEKVEASRELKKAVEKSIELDPNQDLAWHVLGGWHQRLAELGTVKRALAQMLYGDMPPASNEEAVKCFKKAIELNPKRSIHHIELGRTYAQMGNMEEAKKCIEKGLEMPETGKDDREVKQRGRDTLASLK